MRHFTVGLGIATCVLVATQVPACGGDDGARANANASDGGAGSDSTVDGGPKEMPREDAGSVYADAAIAPTTACKPAGGTQKVVAPTFVRTIQTGETGWFSSPALVDLDGDGKKEIIAPLYSTFVFDAAGKQLGKGTRTQGRVYAPAVVADIDKDGAIDIVVGGNKGTVAAYTFKNGKLLDAWQASTDSGGESPEARGMAAGDLDGDGSLEIAVTTTNTSKTGSQVFVLDAKGHSYQPANTAAPAWPRYNATTDATFNGVGNHGYGCYGENVAIGNVDDDPELEVIATYDNHQINVFNHDGTSMMASDWYTNHATEYSGKRMGWGQFIRWADPKVEDDHYHLHLDPWPEVATTMWLQWTASPPNVVDMNGDGKNEIVGIPNAEMKEPYETQGFAFMALEGSYGNGARSGRRLAGFETLPFSDKPVVRADDDYYPPSGIPAAATVSILGDARPEIVAPINDGFIYAIASDGKRLWRYDFAKGAAKTFASEVAIADLNKDGAPEIIFGTYSLTANGGHLVVLANTGELLADVTLPGQGMDGNGIGVPAAPAIADLDGDGQLEIVVTTFDHGLDVFTVPGSGSDCMLWTTGRGGPLRSGTGK